MGKASGAYKSGKRRKELMRQKKQEEKRQKRFNKNVVKDDKQEAETPAEAEAPKETEGSSECATDDVS